jgi:hypothetical protein
MQGPVRGGVALGIDIRLRIPRYWGGRREHLQPPIVGDRGQGVASLGRCPAGIADNLGTRRGSGHHHGDAPSCGSMTACVLDTTIGRG